MTYQEAFFNLLKNKISTGSHGLTVLEAMTGSGKTYLVARAIADAIRSGSIRGRIICLTSLNKNNCGMFEELQKAINDDEVFNSNILWLHALDEPIIDNIIEIDIPDEFKSKTYLNLRKAVCSYNKAPEVYKNYELEIISKLNSEFRREIRSKLCEYPTKGERINAIKNDPSLQWISTLYPQVFTDSYKVLVMSVSKFLVANPTLVEPTYDFLSWEGLNNATIFIDEFDSTKEVINNQLFETSLKYSESYLEIIRNKIFPNWSREWFSSDVSRADVEMSTDITFDQIRTELEELVAEFNIIKSFKTVSAFDIHKYFVFHDLNYITIVPYHGEGDVPDRVVPRFNESMNINELNVVNHKMLGSEDYHSLVPMLRRIQRIIREIQAYVYNWATHYQRIVNLRRLDSGSNTEAEINLESCIYTFTGKLGLSIDETDLIMNNAEIRVPRMLQNTIFQDNSYYTRGFGFNILSDSDRKNEDTEFSVVDINVTPEKILLYLALKANVIGISATAEYDTCIRNYSLKYFERMLGNDFHRTPEYLKKILKDEMKSLNTPYEKGDIKIVDKVLPSSIPDINQYLCDEFGIEYGSLLFNMFCGLNCKNYIVERFSRLAVTMKHFLENDDIKSLLHFSMVLPKPSSSDSVYCHVNICNLFDIVKRYVGDENSSLVVLSGNNFDGTKKDILERLGNGQKILVLTSYKTLSAGQTLKIKLSDEMREQVQYLGDIDPNDSRYDYKDFDAIYLSEVTNKTVDLWHSNKIEDIDLLRAISHAEELYDNGEIDYDTKSRFIRNAFYKNAGINSGYVSIMGERSVTLGSSLDASQAVGRFTRCRAKNKRIHILLESKLLSELDSEELSKHVLPPEMDKILELKKLNGNSITTKDNRVLNQAELISNRANDLILNMKNNLWKINSSTYDDFIWQWYAVRELMLRNPTPSSEEVNSNSDMQSFYITSGYPMDSYMYAESADYKSSIICWGNNRDEFMSSKRLKIKREGGVKPIIKTVSVDDSGLPLVLKYPGMREYFESRGYATEWNKSEYLLCPPAYHNIYKGALGEVAGEFILKKELGIVFNPAKDSRSVEFFDFKLNDDIYFDMKNWKISYLISRKRSLERVLSKMDAIGARRAIIVNVRPFDGSENYECATYCEGRIITIPALIDMNGHIIRENIKYISGVL